MQASYSSSQIAEVSLPTWHRPSVAAASQLPTWKQVGTWLLFWPMMNLVARQAPFLSGPAKTEAQIREGAAAGGLVDYHLALYIVLCFQVCFVISRPREIVALVRRSQILVVCAILPLVSSLWSGNLGNSLRMSVQADLSIAFAAYLYLRFPAERLRYFLIFLGTAAALLSTATAIALPRYGIFAEYAGGAWNGIANHKNTLGLSMMYLLTPIFFVPTIRRNYRFAYAGLLLLVIFESQSRGAWIDTFALLALLGAIFLIRRLPSSEAWLAILLTAGIAVAALVGTVAFFDTLAPMLGKDASMTGRAEIYHQAWLCIQKRPWLGYGYGGFWDTAPEAHQFGINIGWPNIGYSENGLLELALQLGAPGVVLVLALLGRALVQALRLVFVPGPAWRASGWYLSILVLALLTNIDAGWLLVPGTLDWLMIVIACIGLNDEWRRYKAHRRSAGAMAVYAPSAKVYLALTPAPIAGLGEL